MLDSTGTSFTGFCTVLGSDDWGITAGWSIEVGKKKSIQKNTAINPIGNFDMDCQSLVKISSEILSSDALNISNEEEESSELPGSELVGLEGGEESLEGGEESLESGEESLSKTSDRDNDGSGGEVEDGGIIALWL